MEDEAERFTEAVLSLVERIPPGRVMSYGSIATAVGAGGPRQVGRVLALEGGGVPWWRVVRADGTPYSAQALREYAREGTPLRPGRGRVDMSQGAWLPPA